MKFLGKSLLGTALVISALVSVFVAIIFWKLLLQDIIETTSGPVTREEAQGHCRIPLPVSAHHVQYASFTGGLQVAEQYVRFEAPVDDCYSHAQALIEAHKKGDSGYKVQPFLTTNHPAHPPSSQGLHVDWFDTENIVNGVVSGNGYDGNSPRIWIDLGRGVFYYYLDD